MPVMLPLAGAIVVTVVVVVLEPRIKSHEASSAAIARAIANADRSFFTRTSSIFLLIER
jgi:hypothetical protein